MKRSKSYAAVAEKVDSGSCTHRRTRWRSPRPIQGKVRRDRGCCRAARCRSSEGGSDGPRHGQSAQRHREDGPRAVFATGERAEAAKAAGADEVGSDELIDKVSKGYLDFDAVVATPDMMGKVGRLGRILGPRGLMPNPKTGTVTMDVGKAVSDIKGGKIEFRVDRHANLHFIIGKASFSTEQLSQNYFAALDEIIRLKPSAAKGRYLRKITLSTTMGPESRSTPTRPVRLRVAAANPVRTVEFGCSRAGAQLGGGLRRLPGLRGVFGPPVSRRQAHRRSGGVDSGSC